QRARAVDKHEIRTPAFQKLIDDMIDTMDEYSGIGLAAPQVHESLRLFVAVLDPEGRGEGEATALINPEITILSKEAVEGWEGCLSIPDIRGRVPRAPHIRVSALNREGRRVEIEAHDFPARVIQHETDHLDGILFFDRMRAFESLTFMEEYSRYHARREEEDE
ncbi:MAG: peptide deformylase, partial [Vicinamibacterales bacterium]